MAAGGWLESDTAGLNQPTIHSSPREQGHPGPKALNSRFRGNERCQWSKSTLIEHGLIAHALLVFSNRHQEDRHITQLPVFEPIEPLWQHPRFAGNE